MTQSLFPRSDPQLSTRNSRSEVLESASIIKTSQGILFGLLVTNTGPAQFIHLYDSATLPAANAVPDCVIAIGAGGSTSISFGDYGMAFYKGIVAANSTTAAARTAGAADTLFYGRFK